MVRKFIKDTSWVLGSNVLSKVVNFITLGFLARALGPEQLGYYNALQNSGNYINMMSSLGTLVVIQRIGAKIKEIGAEAVSNIFSNAFTLYLLINILAALALVLFPAYFFELLLDSKGQVNYVLLISLIVLLNAFGQIPLYLILGLEEFKKYSIRNLLSTIVVLVVSVLFIFIMEDNLLAAFYGLILSFLINAFITGFVFYKVVKKFNLKIKLTLRFKVLKEVMIDGFIYYAGNTFLGAITGLVLISLFFKHLTPFEYGFTRIGNAFSLLLSIIPAAIQPVTISFLSTQHARNSYIKSLQLRIIPFLSTLLLVVVSFNMELILVIFFGNEYAGARDIVFGMILVQIPNIYLGLINNYQVGAGHLNYSGFVAILGCVMMIVLPLILVPSYGIKGYFASMYMANIACLGFMAYKEYYRTGQLARVDWNSIWLIGVLVSLSYFMMYASPNYLRIPLTLFVLAIAGLLFWRFCTIDEERNFLLLKIKQSRIRA